MKRRANFSFVVMLCLGLIFLVALQKNRQSRCFSGRKYGSRLLAALFFNGQNDQTRGQYPPELNQSRLCRRQENTNAVALATLIFSLFLFFFEAVFFCSRTAA